MSQDKDKDNVKSLQCCLTF